MVEVEHMMYNTQYILRIGNILVHTGPKHSDNFIHLLIIIEGLPLLQSIPPTTTLYTYYNTSIPDAHTHTTKYMRKKMQLIAVVVLQSSSSSIASLASAQGQASRKQIPVLPTGEVRRF